MQIVCAQSVTSKPPSTKSTSLEQVLSQCLGGPKVSPGDILSEQSERWECHYHSVPCPSGPSAAASWRLVLSWSCPEKGWWRASEGTWPPIGA